MTEAEFYNSLYLTKQDWYRISWGLWTPLLPMKIKIAKALNTDSALIWQNHNQSGDKGTCIPLSSTLEDSK